VRERKGGSELAYFKIYSDLIRIMSLKIQKASLQPVSAAIVLRLPLDNSEMKLK
jgi:hypothetical protein